MNGGARPGAGRKSKAVKYAGQVVEAENRIADRLPALIDNMFALADGVTVQEATYDGTTRVFTRPPDRQANEYLINRILGKPTERREIAGPNGEAMGPSLDQIMSRLLVEFGDDGEARSKLARSFLGMVPAADTDPDSDSDSDAPTGDRGETA